MKHYNGVFVLFLLSGIAILPVGAQTPPLPAAQPPTNAQPPAPQISPEDIKRQEESLRNIGFINAAMGYSGRVRSALNAAERAGDGQNDPNIRAEKMLDAYLKSLQLSIADLNSASTRKGKAIGGSGLETFALNGLAGTIYVNHDRYLLDAANRRKVDWNQDRVASVQIAAALLRPKARARLLVNAVADTKGTDIADFSMAQNFAQMAMDNGKWAPRFAETILRERKDSLPPKIAAILKDNIAFFAPNYRTSTDIPRRPVGQWDAKANLYTPSQPDKAAAITVGQSFLYIPDTETILTDTVTNNRLTAAQTALRVLTIRSIESRDTENEEVTLLFSLPGYPHLVRWTGGDALHEMHGLRALVTDTDLRAAQKRFVGKRVWAYPGAGFSVVTDNPHIQSSESRSIGQPVLIKAIYRVNGSTFMSGGRFGGISEEPNHGYSARDPLLIVAKLVGGSAQSSISVGGDGITDLPPIMQRDMGVTPTKDKEPKRVVKVVGYILECADMWDFDHILSPISRETASKGWSPVFRKAVKDGRLIKGMTPDMVAWIIGWPAVYGTLAELRRRPEWVYNAFEGDFTVYFKNGKLIRWVDGSRNLP